MARIRHSTFCFQVMKTNQDFGQYVSLFYLRRALIERKKYELHYLYPLFMLLFPVHNIICSQNIINNTKNRQNKHINLHLRPRETSLGKHLLFLEFCLQESWQPFRTPIEYSRLIDKLCLFKFFALTNGYAIIHI